MLHLLLSPAVDRGGRPSALKIATLALLLAPAAWLIARYLADDLGPRPFIELNHQAGFWTVRLVFITLAITPLRSLLRWPKLIQVRRMVGVAAALYAIAHLIAYTADQAFNIDRVASEIFARIYLTIGFAALIALLLLLATSTDGMVRRLGGRRWRLLHRLVYAIGALAVVHFVMQSKLDVTQPTMMGGLFIWLMAYRLVGVWLGEKGRLPLWTIVALAPASAVLTMVGEALYFWLHNGVDPTRVLEANLSLAAGLRPGWIVLAIASFIALIGVLRRNRGARRQDRPMAAAAE